jgi:hypothetical protein
MRPTLLALAQFLGLVMLADFLAGVVHWLEDAYGTEDTPVVGPLVIRPNIVHHHFPRFFTRLTWWESSWELALLGAAPGSTLFVGDSVHDMEAGEAAGSFGQGVRAASFGKSAWTSPHARMQSSPQRRLHASSGQPLLGEMDEGVVLPVR